MIEVTARVIEEEMKTKAGVPTVSYSEAGYEARYLMPDSVESVKPSECEGWGSRIRFKSGKEWTVRDEPKEVAERISMKSVIMNTDSQ